VCVGTGSILGLAPAPECSFLIYVSPVASYFKGGITPIDLLVSTKFHRAAPGGAGGTKCVGNYAQVLTTQVSKPRHFYVNPGSLRFTNLK
jgi:branched-chain amino acid aminotransferase